MKSHWTHAELLTALATPARRATDGVARALGLRAEGAEEPFAAEPEAVPAAPPLRPDPAWATAARGLVRPGWAPPPAVKRHVTPDASPGAAAVESPPPAADAPSGALIPPAATPMPLVAEDPFEPIGAHPVAQAEALSPSLGFEPLNHPLLRAQAPAARAVYEVGAPPPRAQWSTFDPDPFDDLGEPSPPPGAPGSRTPSQAQALSR
ncbi:hypothetical protein L6R49_14965, partial [Myxococcota bacterium]|nr:hypothetical protein [Myxococcota bacterium]